MAGGWEESRGYACSEERVVYRTQGCLGTRLIMYSFFEH